MPDIGRASRYQADDPRERKYGSAQYLDHASRRYREEFEYARKDLDRFQRFGSFKDYGHHYHDDRYKDKYGSEYYRGGRSHSEDPRYTVSALDKYYDTKDPYSQSDRYRDTRTNTEKYRDEERLRNQQRHSSKSRWKDQRDLYDSTRYQETVNPLYMDDRARDYRDAYDSRTRDGYSDRYHDDRQYDTGYRSHSAHDPYRDTQSVYTSTQYRDDRAYSEGKYRDSSRYYNEFESGERDRKHRSRNPPHQLNLEGRAGPASPSRRDEMRSRDRKVCFYC